MVFLGSWRFFTETFPEKEEADRYWILTAGFSKDSDSNFLLDGFFGFSVCCICLGPGYWIGLDLDFLVFPAAFAALGFLVFYTDQLLTQNYTEAPVCTIAVLLIFQVMVNTALIVKQRKCRRKNNVGAYGKNTRIARLSYIDHS